jgi:hypothetical protein
MSEFIEHLKKQRKVAVRLGKLADTQAHYSLRPKVIRELCDGKKQFSNLTEKDFSIDVDQKGVDMKIGIDIGKQERTDTEIPFDVLDQCSHSFDFGNMIDPFVLKRARHSVQMLRQAGAHRLNRFLVRNGSRIQAVPI